MQPPRKFAIVGAGGIACYLAPMLAKLGSVVLIDADNYEPHNSSRQFPALKSTGNKARVLAELIQPQTIFSVEAIPKYVEDAAIVNEKEWEGVDMIIGAVDNNKSRHILFDLGDAFGIPVICGGNEHAHGEAHMLLSGHYYPQDHFEFPRNEPAPFDCNSDKVLEEHPQTAIANCLAAGAVMHLLLSYQSVENPLNAVVYSRLDTLSSTYSRARDLMAAKGSTH